MVFTNASKLFDQAMLIISIQHMHKVGFCYGGNKQCYRNQQIIIHKQGYCWALHKMTEKNSM